MKQTFQALFIISKGFGLVTLLILSSCSGYRIKNTGNPFESYKIRTLTVPMFVNHSTVAKASVPFTKEFVRLLSRYPNLKVYSGEDTAGMDAILIGIVTSKKYLHQTFVTKNEKFTEGKLKNSIGDRREFFVPTATGYEVSLRVVLIKNPRKAEVELAKSELAAYLQSNPSKIIFNHVMDVTGSFNREAGDTVNPDSPGTVNFSKNKGNFESSLSSTAKSAATQFKETVLDVF